MLLVLRSRGFGGQPLAAILGLVLKQVVGGLDEVSGVEIS